MFAVVPKIILFHLTLTATVILYKRSKILVIYAILFIVYLCWLPVLFI